MRVWAFQLLERCGQPALRGPRGLRVPLGLPALQNLGSLVSGPSGPPSASGPASTTSSLRPSSSSSTTMTTPVLSVCGP
eukprot:7361758-Alexandrium_andersonii.AAC.1